MRLLLRNSLSLQGCRVTNQTDDSVAWVLLMHQLEEAKEHLPDLTNQMATMRRIDEAEFANSFGQVCARMNRTWHGGNQTCELTDGQQRTAFTQFPRDMSPSA
jgi:hypothetical protein